MIDVDSISEFESDFVIDTGSPHYIKFVKDVGDENFKEKARSIRHNDTFNEKGINVNFVQRFAKWNSNKNFRTWCRR